MLIGYHIENLSSAVRGIVSCKKAGIYFPQDTECFTAFEIAGEIAHFYGKRFRKTRLFNIFLRILEARSRKIRGIFGGYLCDQSLNTPKEWIAVKGIREAVQMSESGWQLTGTRSLSERERLPGGPS